MDEYLNKLVQRELSRLPNLSKATHNLSTKLNIPYKATLASLIDFASEI